MKKHKKQQPAKSLTKPEKRQAKAKAIADAAMRLYNLPAPILAILEAIFGKLGFTSVPNAADLILKFALMRMLVRIVTELQASWLPTTQAYFVTFIMDAGSTSDRMPTPDIDMLISSAMKALKRVGLHGIIFVEVHPLMNHPRGGEGRTLLWHCHIIAWAHEPVDIGAATRTIELMPGFVCSLGAKPVMIVPIDTDAEMKRVCEYVTKPVYSAKNLMPKTDTPGSVIMMDTEKGLRPEFVLRTAEGMSQLHPFDLIKGVGEGRGVVKTLRQEVMAWHRARKTDGLVLPRTFDTWAFWLKFREEFGSKNYYPFRFNVAELRGPIRRQRKPRVTPTSTRSRRSGSKPMSPGRRAAIRRAQKRSYSE